MLLLPLLKANADRKNDSATSADQINDSALIFSIHAPRESVIHQAKTAELNTKIQVDLLEGLVGTPIVLSRMKLLNGYQIRNTNTDF